jgi:hypothetical protein
MTAETDPKSPSITSWMYNTASTFLSHVVAVEPPPVQEPKPKAAMQEPTSLVDFIYDLAGLSPSQDQSLPIVEEIFDSSKVAGESDVPVTDSITDVPEEPQPQEPDVYIPTTDTKITYSEPILSSKIMLQLQPHLPTVVRIASTTTLLYSMEQHGTSIKTLYRRCAEYEGASILVVQTQEHVFGAFINEHVHLQTGYYGNGEWYR